MALVVITVFYNISVGEITLTLVIILLVGVVMVSGCIGLIL